MTIVLSTEKLAIKEEEEEQKKKKKKKIEKREREKETIFNKNGSSCVRPSKHEGTHRIHIRFDAVIKRDRVIVTPIPTGHLERFWL